MIQVGEGERGYLLELLLTKWQYTSVSSHPHAKQPIFLSSVAYSLRSSNLILSLVMIQVGEGERGYLLELLLTKLLYAAVSPHPHATYSLFQPCVAQLKPPSHFRSGSGWGGGKGVSSGVAAHQVALCSCQPRP